MNIVVVGMGYVGIPIAALFADVPGFQVTGIQRRSKRSERKIDLLNKGLSPFKSPEPGLDTLLRRVVDKGTFKVTDDISTCREADATLIAVQTPVNENHIPEYESLQSVLHDIGRHMKPCTLICLESTVAPGTTNYLVKPILEEKSKMKAGEDFNLVFSYERAMVGRLLHNLTLYDRVVGGITTKCSERGLELYRKIVKANLYSTDALTAEVAKVTENAYRDVNIAFANEVALICESLGVNIHDVRRFVNSLPNDPSNPSANPYRMMHIPGAGVGGHCLPKDSWLLKYGLDTYGNFSFIPEIIIGSRKLNDNMPIHMKELAAEALQEKGLKIYNAKIGILGLAFLENSDDTRNTPTLPLYKSLKLECKDLIVHDPYIDYFEGINLTNDLNEAVNGIDCAILVTRHKDYLIITPEWLKERMSTLAIVDGRNAFDKKRFQSAGFSFKGVGLPRIL